MENQAYFQNQIWIMPIHINLWTSQVVSKIHNLRKIITKYLLDYKHKY